MVQALYRRYRPEVFADVIGQEHVTGPLQQALRNDRVHHAYLFSGPRGCGKTTSARILARCLNCERGPTPEPCGQCASCRDLARNGPGSLDVVEIDAASHGGVDDARDLRERAFFAPAGSRFKVYIVDEAHMVSSAGFNALLKVVEEPPAHLKFIFATTEPEKVIGTIRSRTHHYPFRLVPPKRLGEFLAAVCDQEGVQVEKGVLPLVVRAGRGSVRDALSVLDQLVAGAENATVTYRGAVALLGFTDATLLDDTIEAFAAGDATEVFRVVDRVMESGHDPRRFTEDLLERLRDLVILQAVPDAVASMFGDLPTDQLERMRQQGGRFGAAELSRAADLINTGLTEMRGATAPRLQLELICARVLLPEAADDPRGVHARLDRLERRVALGGMPPSTPPPSARPTPAAPGAQAAPATGRDSQPPAAPASPDQPPGLDATDAGPTAGAGGAAELDLAAVRRMWPDVLEAVKGRRRFTWTLLSTNASVAGLDGRRLTLAMVNAGARDSFAGSGSDDIVRQALIDVLGVDWTVEAIVDPSAPPAGVPARPDRPAAAAPRSAAARGGPGTTGTPVTPATQPEPTQPDGTGPEGPQPEGTPAASSRPERVAAGAPGPVPPEDDEASEDDPDLDQEVSSLELLQRNLGAKVIREFDTAG